MKIRLLALALGTCLALHPSDARAQDATAPEMRSRTTVRNPNANRSGPRTGVSLGFSGFSPGRLKEFPTVRALTSGGSGERAGLMVGDTIRTVNGRDARQLPVFPNRAPGARYVLRIRRGGEDREVTMVLPNTPPTPTTSATPAAPQRQR